MKTQDIQDSSCKWYLNHYSPFLCYSRKTIEFQSNSRVQDQKCDKIPILSLDSISSLCNFEKQKWKNRYVISVLCTCNRKKRKENMLSPAPYPVYNAFGTKFQNQIETIHPPLISSLVPFQFCTLLCLVMQPSHLFHSPSIHPSIHLSPHHFTPFTSVTPLYPP